MPINRAGSTVTFDNFDSDRLMTKKRYMAYWFGLSHDSMIRINCWFVDLLGLSLNFVDLFGLSINFVCFLGAFRSSVAFVWPFGTFDSSAFARISLWLKQYLEDLKRFNSWLKRLSRNWLRINSWLKWIRQELIQINSWSFRFKSTHDSNEKHLILTRLMNRLWVIPVSDYYAAQNFENSIIDPRQFGGGGSPSPFSDVARIPTALGLKRKNR